MGSILIDDIKKILNCNDSLIIFEIGSNTGSDTRRFLKAFPNMNIYCFEPDSRCIRKFKKIINEDRVTLIEAAVSDNNGVIDFYLSGGSKKNHKSQHISSSSIKTPLNHLKKHPWCKFEKTIKVNTVSLDSWCNDNSIDYIDFIWADVQGAEEELILGAKNILRKTKYFYTECSDEELYRNQINKDTLKEMLPWFDVKEDFGNNILLENKEI